MPHLCLPQYILTALLNRRLIVFSVGERDGEGLLHLLTGLFEGDVVLGRQLDLLLGVGDVDLVYVVAGRGGVAAERFIAHYEILMKS